jgi:hypothetical protein
MRVVSGMAWATSSILVFGMAAMPMARADSTQPATLYVFPHATTCSDSGPGSQAQPYCTLQAAADAATAGDTVAIEAGVDAPTTITQSGTPGAPITFTWVTRRQYIYTGSATGHPMITLQGVHDVTLSGLGIDHVDGDDGIDVIGSSDITLDRLYVSHLGRTAADGAASTGISIDGASTNVTISRSEVIGGGQHGVYAAPGAQGVTLYDDGVLTGAGPAVTLDGTVGAVVTNNTLGGLCANATPATDAPNALTLTDGTSAVVENNVLQVKAASTCPAATQGAALSVDAASASGVQASYNALYAAPSPVESEYSWEGTTYSTAASFAAAVPGQGAHDLDMTTSMNLTAPPEGSPLIDSADCAAPDATSTDFNGNPRVDDPLVPNTGTGTCYGDRGAIERQDSIPAIADKPSPANASGIQVGIVPFTFTDVITPATSAWGQPLSYTVNYGDGTPSVTLAADTAQHPYTAEGQYGVTITATTPTGLTATKAVTVNALGATPHVPVVTAVPYVVGNGEYLQDSAQFSATDGTFGWELASAAFDNGQGDPDGFVNFGPAAVNAQTSTIGTAPAMYDFPGTFTGTIEITDLAGRTTSGKATITVGEDIKTTTTPSMYSHTIPAHGTVDADLSAIGVDGLMNLVVTGNAKSGALIVYARGQPRPSLATVQFQAGRPAENSVLAGGSHVDLYNNSAAPIHVQFWAYAAATRPINGDPFPAGGAYTPVAPARVLSTTKVAANHTVAIQAAGIGNVPDTAAAVVLDLTESGATAAGHYVTWPEKNEPHGLLTGMYWAPGQQVTGLVTVPTPADGRVIVSNASTGTASFTADVVGYYTTPAGVSGMFFPAKATRLLTVTIAAKHSVKLAVAGKDKVPATGTTAVMVNLTASGETANGSIAAYADGTTRPADPALSYSAGQAIAGAAIVAVGKDGAIDLYNNSSKPVTITVDLTGSFYSYP